MANITVKKLKIVASWNYNTENKECSICNTDLLTPVIDYNNKLNGDIQIGSCYHGFHSVCMKKWEKKDMSCPYCKITWKLINNT